jgi:hypothetical protein
MSTSMNDDEKREVQIMGGWCRGKEEGVKVGFV